MSRRSNDETVRATQRATATVAETPRPLAAPLSIAPGDHIRHYQLIREIGRGGMGQVFLARDTRLDREVAMKFIASPDRELTRRFVREARATARCTHPNIVVIHEVDEHDDVPYMVLEYLEGEPLSALARRSGRVSIERALEVMIPTLRALERAHELGIVHRDLKLENIFITSAGQVKVLDFGVAKVLDDDDGHTAVGAWIGTPAYMAPEQLQAEEVDGRADLWACGIILHILLAGRHPMGDGGAEAVVAALIENDGPLPGLAASAPELPADLCRIVDACLTRRKEERWPHARALIDALATVSIHDARPAPPARTVAVLPFRNGGPADDAYLADGLTEDLIDALSMTEGLRVKPRSSTRRFTGDVDHAAIGAELGVQVIVDGSVRRRGDDLHISARVVSVTDCFQEWSRRFDRPTGDALAVNEEVAAALAAALTVSRPPATRAPGTDAAAIDLYLRGRAALRGLDRASIERAIDLLGQAHGRAPGDPTILAACARAGARALFFRSDPTLAERALDLARRAFAAAPHNAEVELALAQVHFALGEHVAAAAHAARASRRAPFLAEAHALVGRIQIEVGPLERGCAALDRALAIDPELVATQLDRARAAALHGDFEPARRLAAAGGSVETATQASLVARYALWQGDLAAWEHLIPPVSEADPMARGDAVVAVVGLLRGGGLPPGFDHKMRGLMAVESSVRFRCLLLQFAAELFAAAGDAPTALGWITRGVEAGVIDLVWLDLCPVLAAARAAPGFAAVRADLAARTAPIRAALEQAS